MNQKLEEVRLRSFLDYGMGEWWYIRSVDSLLFLQPVGLRNELRS